MPRDVGASSRGGRTEPRYPTSLSRAGARFSRKKMVSIATELPDFATQLLIFGDLLAAIAIHGHRTAGVEHPFPDCEVLSAALLITLAACRSALRRGSAPPKVWRRHADTADWGQIDTIVRQYYVDAPVTPGQYYEYKVRAVAAKYKFFSNTAVVYGATRVSAPPASTASTRSAPSRHKAAGEFF